MLRPFPTTTERKREAYAAMVREAPDVMVEVAALMKQFPGSKLTYFKAGTLELGLKTPVPQPVDDEICVMQREARRKAAKAKK
jgi:hypothetical protein